MARRNAAKKPNNDTAGSTAGSPAVNDQALWDAVNNQFGNVSSVAPISAAPPAGPQKKAISDPPVAHYAPAPAAPAPAAPAAPQYPGGLDLATQLLGMFFGGGQPAPAPSGGGTAGKPGTGFGNATYGGGQAGDQGPGDAGLQGENPYGSYVNGEYIPGDQGGYQGAYSGGYGNVAPWSSPAPTGAGAAGFDQLFGPGTAGQPGANGVDSTGTNGGVNFNGYALGGNINPAVGPVQSAPAPVNTGGGAGAGAPASGSGGGYGGLFNAIFGNAPWNAPWQDTAYGGSNINVGTTHNYGSYDGGGGGGGGYPNGYFGSGGYGGGSIINQNTSY